MRDETEIQKVLHGVRSRFLKRSIQELQSVHLVLEKLNASSSEALVELGSTLRRIAATANILELEDVAEHARMMEPLVKAISPGQQDFDLPQLLHVWQDLNNTATSTLAALEQEQEQEQDVPPCRSAK